MLALGGSLRAGQVQVGRGPDEPVNLSHRECREHDAFGVGGVVIEAMLGSLLAAGMLGVVVGPLPEREDGLPGLFHGPHLGVSQSAASELLTEFDGFGEDDLLLGLQEGHLADLPEVHADGVIDAGRVLGHGLRLGLGRGLVVLELGRRLPPRLLLTLLDRDLQAQLGGLIQPAMDSDLIFLLGLDEVGPGVPSLAPLEDRCDEQLVGGGRAHVRPAW